MQTYDNSGNEKLVYKGDLYMCDLGDSTDSRSSVQQGYRPVIILQNDAHNQCSNTTVIAPLTTRRKKNLKSHVDLNKGEGGIMKDSTILLEQMRTVNIYQLEKYIGTVNMQKIYEIDDAIFAVLDL